MSHGETALGPIGAISFFFALSIRSRRAVCAKVREGGWPALGCGWVVVPISARTSFFGPNSFKKTNIANDKGAIHSLH